MTDPTRPYWDDAKRFPPGTRVRIHLSPEEPTPTLATYGALADDAAVRSMAHPPGSDGRTGTVLAMPTAPLALPGHTVYVTFDAPIIIPVSPEAIILGGAPAGGLRCRGDVFAPTELEIIGESETPS